MRKYIKPKIKIVCFTSSDAVLTASEVEINTYAANNLNSYMLNGIGINQTTTVKVQNILQFNSR